ncbi:outer membrane lipoprotein-sorting protein [Marinomonas sp. PE14-40]|uniref:outer membrane lipoprotein-sorting protein n=1 Tax=Marinomonas sp. PE14-40 TaxID=3060621 RepID=UPI003F66D1E9
MKLFNYKAIESKAMLKVFGIGLLTASLTSFPVSALELSAKQIMQKVDDRDTGETIVSESALILIDKKKRQRIRQLKLFSKEYEQVDKSVSFFMSPADVKDTAYMSFDWDDDAKEDDSWLYLPALQKTNRIAASDKSGAFMGSDFSYADIDGVEVEDFTYRLVKESEEVNGHDCWVIESTPKSKVVIKETGYLTTTSWIRKDIFMQVKAIIKVKKGKRVKYFQAKDIEQIQGIWTAKTLQMVTTKRNKLEHSSVLKINAVDYQTKVDDKMFENNRLQRGL